MYKVPKVKKIGDFWPLIKHFPHCNLLFQLSKMKQINTLNAYTIWKESISFDMKEKINKNTSLKFCEGKTKFRKF
jgi:hypothetical protein